ncbi:MAG: tetratricopeptide repeat protein [Myxococcota bacterium]
MNLLTSLLTLFCVVARADGLDDAEALLQQGRSAAAMSTLRNHIDANPDDVSAHELLIDLYLNAGLLYEIEEAYKQHVDQQAASADAWYLLGRATVAPDRSARAFERALQIDPDHARTRMGQAALRRVAKDLEGAQRDYTAALERDPSLEEAWVGLWTVQQQLGATRAATETAARASVAIPSLPEAWLTLATLQPAQAPRHLAEGLKHSPQDPRLLSAFARQMFLTQDTNQAMVAYDRALARSPEDARLRLERSLLTEIGDQRLSWPGAIVLRDARNAPGDPTMMRQIDQTISQHPRSAVGRVIRGNLRQGSGDVAGAMDDLQTALSINPESPAANAAMGLLLLSQREPEKAIGPLKIAATARPDDVALGVATAVAIAEGESPRAGAAALIALHQQFPASEGPPMALAQMMLQLGDAEGAMMVLQEAVQLNPEPKMVIMLASAAQQAGKPQQAGEALLVLARQTGDPRLEKIAEQLKGNAP